MQSLWLEEEFLRGRSSLQAMEPREHTMRAEVKFGEKWRLSCNLLEMECCHHVMVTADKNGGIEECHPYVMGTYKKIGVCGGRPLYQHDNNTEIFMYYGCGRWFIGLEVGLLLALLWATSLIFCR